MNPMFLALRLLLFPTILMALSGSVWAQGEWETNAESELALERGLAWLARTQGSQWNWESNDLGLVSLGALAFLSAGHMPGKGKYGENVDRALQYIVKNAKPSGLLNIADAQRDLYNHGLTAFVLGQAYGMTDDAQIGKTLEKALKLIANTQCDDGGWDYRARRQAHGHDLSLAVMQAKALRSAVDSGFEVRNDVIKLAIQSVRDHYKADNGARGLDERAKDGTGQFTYDGNRGTVAMAACGVVCLQEFGQYDDWRIPKNLDLISKEVSRLKPVKGNGEVPFDAYTLYYVGQALYQSGGDPVASELSIAARPPDHVATAQAGKRGRRRIVARHSLGPREARTPLRHRSQLFRPGDPQPISADPAGR